MRPETLAPQLGISPKTLRAWLRLEYARSAQERHKPWVLSAAQVEAARRRFARLFRRAASREGMVTTTIALPAGLHSGLSKAAAEERTGTNELIREAASEWLERRKRAKRYRRGER